MIEVYDTHEKQHVMLNVNKIIIIYHSHDMKHALVKLDDLEYPIKTQESYEEIKKKVKEV